MRLDSSGNLLVGTSSGTSIQLHVDGSRASGLAAQLTNSNSSTGSGIVVKGGSSSSNYSADFRDYNNTTLMRIRGDGNVGIGTSSPSAKLHINLGTDKNLLFAGNIGEIGSVAGFQAVNDAGSALGSFGIRATDMRFAIGSSERMRIDASGNVGIGTDSPAHKLVVAGSSSTDFDALILRNSNGTNGSAAVLTFETSSGTEGDDAASAAHIKGIREDSGTDGALAFSTTLAGTPTERMRIKSSGNVGIGSDSPDAMLRIDQDATATGLKVTGGNGGVALAEFTRDVGSTGTVEINASGGDPQIKFASAGNTFSIGANSTAFEIADNAALGTNARFTINSTGNVGIGTSNLDTL